MRKPHRYWKEQSEEKKEEKRKDFKRRHREWYMKYREEIRKKQKEYHIKNKEKMNEKSRRYQRENKEKYRLTSKKLKSTWLDYVGLNRVIQCEICGYNRCSEALDFHHKEPYLKRFDITDFMRAKSPTLKNKSILDEELNKTVILCATCHRELHFKLRNNVEF